MAADFARALQRAGPIGQMAALLREFSVDPADVVRGTGIHLDDVSPDSLIPFADVLRLLEKASIHTGCSHFGLLLGARYAPDAHGVIARLAAQGRTLRQALLAFVSLQPGYSSGATVYLGRLGTDAMFGYGIYDRTSPGSSQLYDCVLAFGCGLVNALTGGAVEPMEVWFCHRQPRDLAPYRRVLSAPLRFNQNQSGLVISGPSLDHPLAHQLPGRPEQDEDETKLALDIAHLPASVRLRHLIRPQLLAGDALMETAARALGLIPRTLRRHLADEGLTFEVIRDEVRYVLARELLALTDLPIGDISVALAFSNQTAFVRAFRRWSGSTPSRWRSGA